MIGVLVELTTTLALTLLIRASRTLRTVVFTARRWNDQLRHLRIRNDAAYHYLVTVRRLPLDLFNKIMRIVDWPRALTLWPHAFARGYQSRPRTATRKERRVHLVTQKEVRKGLITNIDGTLIATRRTPAIGGRTRVIADQRLSAMPLRPAYIT
jgi:hypothetical protein